MRIKEPLRMLPRRDEGAPASVALQCSGVPLPYIRASSEGTSTIQHSAKCNKAEHEGRDGFIADEWTFESGLAHWADYTGRGERQQAK